MALVSWHRADGHADPAHRDELNGRTRERGRPFVRAITTSPAINDQRIAKVMNAEYRLTRSPAHAAGHAAQTHPATSPQCRRSR